MTAPLVMGADPGDELDQFVAELVRRGAVEFVTDDSGRQVFDHGEPVFRLINKAPLEDIIREEGW